MTFGSRRRDRGEQSQRHLLVFLEKGVVSRGKDLLSGRILRGRRCASPNVRLCPCRLSLCRLPKHFCIRNPKSLPFLKKFFQAVQDFREFLLVEAYAISRNNRMAPKGVDLELPWKKGNGPSSSIWVGSARSKAMAKGSLGMGFLPWLELRQHCALRLHVKARCN